MTALMSSGIEISDLFSDPANIMLMRPDPEFHSFIERPIPNSNNFCMLKLITFPGLELSREVRFGLYISIFNPLKVEGVILSVSGEGPSPKSYLEIANYLFGENSDISFFHGYGHDIEHTRFNSDRSIKFPNAKLDFWSQKVISFKNYSSLNPYDPNYDKEEIEKIWNEFYN